MKLNIEQTVKNLRETGHKVHITHYRFTRSGGIVPSRTLRETKEGFTVSPNGGEVLVEIVTPEGRAIKCGSFCSPQDNFNRRVGTTIALGRAVQQLHEVS
jgi:hypothetical protein